MADETILIDIEYNTDEAEKEVDSLTESIEGLKVAQSQLKAEVEKGTISEKEASKQKVKLQTQLQSENKQRKDLVKIMQSEKGSRDQLRQSISQLIRERNSLNMTTKQGAKEGRRLQTQINKLDKQLQKTGTTTEKAKGNIGKYGQAMSGLPGPIGGVINSMKMLAKIIFATPLGWLIGLIAGAGAALKTFFVGSAEGQERWNKTMNRAKGVMSVFKDELINIGKGISNFTDNLKNSDEGIKGWANSVKNKAQGAWKNLKKDVEEKGLWTALKDNATDAVDSVKNKFDELGAAIDENTARADALTEKQNALRRNEIDTLTEVAILRRDIAEARAQASDKEGRTAQERLDFLDLAIEKENEILNIEENLAAERIRIQKLQMSQGENTLEDYEQLAQLEKAQIDLETTNARARRKIQSERQTTLREVAAEEKANKISEVDFEAEIDAMILENNVELNNALIEEEKRLTETKEEINTLFEEAKTAKAQNEEEKRKAIINQSLDFAKNANQETTQFLLDLNQARFESQVATLEKQNLTEAQFAKKKEALEKSFARKQKRISITNAVINGALAITKALAQLGPIAGAIASAAIATTTGLQIARISSQQFKKGGQVPLAKRGAKFGTFSGPSHNAGGVQLYTGTGQHVAEVEGNENFYVVNKNASSYINSLSDINQRIGGGVPLSQKGRRFADGGQVDTEGAPSMAEITREVVRNMPPIVVRTVDIKTGLEDRNEVLNAGIV